MNATHIDPSNVRGLRQILPARVARQRSEWLGVAPTAPLAARRTAVGEDSTTTVRPALAGRWEDDRQGTVSFDGEVLRCGRLRLRWAFGEHDATR